MFRVAYYFKVIMAAHNRSSSLNATARNVVRTAYDETALFNVLAPRELDLVLSKINKSH